MQDAHEFLNFLLNELVDILEKESHKVRSELQPSSIVGAVNGPSNHQINGVKKGPLITWVHKNFQVNFLGIYVVPNINVKTVWSRTSMQSMLYMDVF